MKNKLDALLVERMRKHERYVPARLQAALALLERLRDHRELVLDAHVSRGRSGLKSHETFGKRAHDRFKLDRINANDGRRSSNLQDWGQALLDILADAGFDVARSQQARERLIHEAQVPFAEILRQILEEEPLTIRVKGRSVEAVVQDLLRQAEAKGKTGDVAQYLVGAKLMLRFNRDIPVHPANKADRRSRTDLRAKAGDFVIENAVLEVAIGLPDDKHLEQVALALDDAETEFWLLTRSDRVSTWKNELEKFEGVDHRRVVITAVESFVGRMSRN